MPTGPLEVHCQQALEDIVTISQRIRSSALRCTNNQENDQYLDAIGGLRRQLETIRKSAETILEAITLQNCIIDERVIAWLFGGELRPCLDKLKEVDNIFKPDAQVPPAAAPAHPFWPAPDNIARAVVLFEKHKDIFYFLLTPEVWNPELQAPQPDTVLTAEETRQDVQETVVRNSTQREHDHGENGPQSNADQEVKRKKEFVHQKLDEVSRWLAALECTDKHNETLKQRQQGTCTWFPSTGAYKVWRSGRSPFLWLHGRGGCGKSVLVASTIEHLKSTLEDGDVLVYYYCDFRDERSMNPAEMMRSILSQLFRQFREFGFDAGAIPNRILEEKSDGTLTLNDLDQLAHLVLRAASRFPREPMILIDALDECADIGKLLPALATLIHTHIRLLVTSRPQEEFKDHFGKYPSLSLHAMGKELAGDIGLHITQEIYSHAQLRSADAKLKHQVRVKLHDKADGRFRWVQCQLDTLKQCPSRQELQDVLDDLPGELETSYERILGKIDERKSETKLVRRALAWLIAALVPLRLAQLVDGLSFDPQRRRIHCGTQSPGTALIDTLSSLVSYNKETDVLALSHLTVKEYLMSRTALPMFHIIPHEAHIEVVEMCMFYITSLLKQVRFRANLAVSKSSPMLSYVFSTGLDHLAHVGPASSVVLEVLQSFASEIHRYPSHWDILCELREEDPRRLHPPWPSSRHDVVLYILTAYSPVSLLDSFLSPSRPFKPRPGTNPLVYAADLWKTAHGISLLGSGVDVTAPGLVVDDSRHALPLEVAVDLGNDVLVDELLQRGSVVTSEMLSTAVCMPWCCTRVLVKLVQTDAFTEWAHEIGDEELYRAIFNSARPNAGDSSQTDRDHVALARRLRELGQDLAPDSTFGAELVERALHSAHTSMLEFLLPPDQRPPTRFLIAACTGNTSETISVVRFLLRKGANLRAVSRGRGDTALHLAAMSPWEPRALELTKMLLSAGCNPGARNRRKETPLTIAVRRGYITVVEHFLSRMAPLPSHILLLALQTRQKPQMIQLLLLRGANIDVCMTDGDLGLHLTINYLEVVESQEFRDEEYVVERVICETRQDQEYAVSEFRDCEDEGGNEVVGNHEEEQYEDEDDRDMYGQCEEYTEVECSEVVKVLIEAGCDPTPCDANGKTVLELAIQRGYTLVVEHLLACGAPLRVPANILLTPLWLGPRSGLKMIELLICKGANVHATTESGNTLLHLAIDEYEESWCLEIVKILIGAGCDPTSCDDGNMTVLELAVIVGYTSVVEHLLECGVSLPADILLTSDSTLDSKMVKLLVHKGVNVHATTKSGDTLLHLAIKHGESQCLEIVKILVGAGCDPTSCGANGKMALELAIEEGYTLVVEHLLTCGAPLRVPANILLTSLWLGPRQSGLKIIELLICKGANVHATMESGNTLLHLAIDEHKESWCLEIVKILIGAGCNPTSCDDGNMSVLELAVIVGYTSVVEHLLECGVPLPVDILLTSGSLWLHSAPDSKMVKLLICKGANVHATTKSGDTLLHLAINKHGESWCLEIVKILVGAGCDPTSWGANGKTVLELAVEEGYTLVVEHLLACGAPLRLPANILLTSLWLGPRQSGLKMIELLICKGANVHATAKSGDTLLHLAIHGHGESWCLEIVKILVGAGCDLTSCGANGKTVLELAVQRGYSSVAEYLLVYNVPLPHEILLTALQYHATPQLIKLLSRKGANIQSTLSSGNTVLHLAITRYPILSCLKLVKIFIQLGCDPSECNSEGKSTWIVTMELGHGSVLVLLLSSRIPYPPDILLMALWYRLTPRVIYFIIGKGARVDLTTAAMGDSALHLIIAGYWECNCPELVRRVVKAGCNPNSCNSMGKSVLMAAVEKGYLSTVALLLSYNVTLPPDILLTALQLQTNPQIIELLIRHGAVVHFTAPSGDTLLQLAHDSYAEPARQLVIDMILTGGVSCRAKRTNLEDGTAVHVSKRPRL